MDVLDAAREADANVSLIVLSKVVTPDLVLGDLRKDFFDFLATTLPPETLRAAVGRACDRTILLRENSFLKQAVGRLEVAGEMIGETTPIREARERSTASRRCRCPSLLQENLERARRWWRT